MIRNALTNISAKYMNAKSQDFAGHALGHFIRKTAPNEIKEAIPDRGLLFAGSCGGSGRWIHVPWLGIYHPAITDSAQRGLYLVYLFSADMKYVYLSLNQGATEVSNEFGKSKRALGELERRAELIRVRVPEYKAKFGTVTIDLRHQAYFPKGYSAGHAFGIRYVTSDLPEENHLVTDLLEGLRLYRLLINRGGISNIETNCSDDEHKTDGSLVERRRYVLHRSIERNSTAARDVKKIHGYTCQACDLNFEEMYGELGKNYIEAHHLTPLHTMVEDQELQLDPMTDFAVLCSNCHRMVHRPKALLKIDELREILSRNK